MNVLDIDPELLARHTALIQAKTIAKKRTCLKCGVIYNVKGSKRRGTCFPCGQSNDNMGVTASLVYECTIR
jgi:hypothetical protein